MPHKILLNKRKIRRRKTLAHNLKRILSETKIKILTLWFVLFRFLNNIKVKIIFLKHNFYMEVALQNLKHVFIYFFKYTHTRFKVSKTVCAITFLYIDLKPFFSFMFNIILVWVSKQKYSIKERFF